MKKGREGGAAGDGIREREDQLDDELHDIIWGRVEIS
jgi:hypothetical protein